MRSEEPEIFPGGVRINLDLSVASVKVSSLKHGWDLDATTHCAPIREVSLLHHREANPLQL